MNWNNYRKAVDAINFSPDFQERTVALLRQARCEVQRKETYTMKHKKLWKAAVAAACAALLSVSAFAAVQWLTPAQVADAVQEPKIAAAFAEEGAVPMDETQEMGDYLVRLAGTTSGKGLSVLNPDVDHSHTYAVLVAERKDGAPVDMQDITATSVHPLPLVKGHDPLTEEGLYAGVSTSYFVQDGLAYWLIDMEGLEPYAGETVYLAVYQGVAPNMFQMAEDGTFSFKDDYTEPRALFTLSA